MTTPQDAADSLTAGDDAWRRLSPWSMLQPGVRLGLYAGPMMLASAAGSDLGVLVPMALVGLAVVNIVLGYLFYRFRISATVVQVRRGWLQRRHLELAFDRIQNITIEEPFYYRLLGLVTLKIDGAGSTSEEVRIAAIPREEADSIRAFIKARRNGGEAPLLPGSERTARDEAAGGHTSGHDLAGRDAAGGDAPPKTADHAELRFSRSLSDLVVHGLTNNRAFIVIAGLFGGLSQTNLSPMELIQRLGVEVLGIDVLGSDFDVLIAGMSMLRLAVLLVVSFLVATALIALLSVLGSIATYYGFSLYRTGNGILVKRGLLTRHEVHVERSRIQSIALRQDWLDYLLGRRNVVLEPITHAPIGNPDPAGGAATGKRILVPSVRLHETAVVTDEVLRVRPDALRYAPASRRLFYVRAVFFAVIYGSYLAVLVAAAANGRARAWWFVAAVVLVWALHTALLRMSWKRKGLAIDGDVVVVRSGVIGVNYAIFSAFKLQRVMRVQSLLMRRRRLSTLVFSTASTAARMPHIDTSLASSVIDYCLYAVESGQRAASGTKAGRSLPAALQGGAERHE